MMRPTTLETFVNSEHVKNLIRFTAEASRIKGTPFPHTIILGKSGAGKTTLGKIIATMMGKNYFEMYGNSFKVDTLFKTLRNMNEGDFLIIDEVHELGTDSLTLYPIIEDGRMFLPSLNRSVKVKPITIIGITNEISMLKQAFIDRFPLRLDLENYSIEDISQVVKINATIPIDNSAAYFIAGISRGTPRQAIDYLTPIENYAIAKRINAIDASVAIAALQSYGIDQYGFNNTHRQIIKTLGDTYTGQAVGISTLSNLVGKSVKDLENIFEGYLLERGIVEKTKSGRILTAKGYEVLDEMKANA